MTLHALDDKRALAAKQAANLRKAARDWERTHPAGTTVPAIRIADAQQRDKDGRLLSDRRT